MPILVFLGLSVLDLDPMYATDTRQTASSLYAPPLERGHSKPIEYCGKYNKRSESTSVDLGQDDYKFPPVARFSVRNISLYIAC